MQLVMTSGIRKAVKTNHPLSEKVLSLSGHNKRFSTWFMLLLSHYSCDRSLYNAQSVTGSVNTRCNLKSDNVQEVKKYGCFFDSVSRFGPKKHICL